MIEFASFKKGVTLLQPNSSVIKGWVIGTKGSFRNWEIRFLVSLPLLTVQFNIATPLDSFTQNTIVERGDFSNAVITEINLANANIRKTNLKNADIRNANFYKADFSKANLDGTNLSSSDLKGADLKGANLRFLCAKKESFQNSPDFGFLTFSTNC